MNLPKYCLDAHPLVWYFTGQKTLSPDAKRALDDIFCQKAMGYIPIIVLLEIFHLSLKNDKFSFIIFFKKLRLTNIIIVPFDKAVLTVCFKLSKNLDIHDRVIAATAIITDSLLITKDKVLSSLSGLRTLW